MHPGRHQECGSATPPVYPAYHPTAEAGGYLKDGRSATACPDTLTHNQRRRQDRSSATARPDTSTNKQGNRQDRGSATACPDTPTDKQRRRQDRSSATACPDTPTDKQRRRQDRSYATTCNFYQPNPLYAGTCVWTIEKYRLILIGCRRATIFQVTPGFSRGVRMAIKPGVAEPHS